MTTKNDANVSFADLINELILNILSNSFDLISLAETVALRLSTLSKARFVAFVKYENNAIKPFRVLSFVPGNELLLFNDNESAEVLEMLGKIDSIQMIDVASTSDIKMRQFLQKFDFKSCFVLPLWSNSEKQGFIFGVNADFINHSTIQSLEVFTYSLGMRIHNSILLANQDDNMTNRTNELKFKNEQIQALNEEYAVQNEMLKEANENLEQANERIAESENRQRQIIQNYPGLFYVKDARGRVIIASKSFETITKKSVADIIGKNNFEIFENKSVSDLFDLSDRETLRLKDGEYLIKEEVFEQRVFETLKYPIVVSGHTYICGHSLDITERKILETRKIESEQQFRTISENAMVGIILGSALGEMIYCNDAFCLMVGYSAQQLKTMVFSQITFPEDLPKEIILLQKLKMDEADFYQMEKRYIKNSGEIIWVEINLSCVRNKDREITHYIGVINNINDRIIFSTEIVRKNMELKLTANTLKEIEHTLKEAQRIGKIGNWETDLNSGEIFWSAETYRIFGYSNSTLINPFNILHKHIHSDDYQNVINHIRFFNNSNCENETIEFKITDAEGIVKNCKSTLEVIFNSVNVPQKLHGTIQDITELKQSQEELKQRNEQLRVIFETVNAGIVLISQDGLVTFANQKMADMFGCSMEYLINSPISNYIFNEDLVYFLENMNSLIQNGKDIINHECRYIRERNLIFWCSFSGQAIRSQNSDFVAAVGVIYDITSFKDTETELHQSKELLQQQNDQYLQLNQELTLSNMRIQKINSELIVAKEYAEKADRLKSAFLANMSHEIRTPMNAIMGFAQLLNNEMLVQEKRKKFVFLINKRCQDLLNIINDILDISKIESNQISIYETKGDLNQLIDDIMQNYSSLSDYSPHKQVEFNSIKGISGKKVIIKADFERLIQIFNNLIGNALKFTEKGFINFGYSISEDGFIKFFVSDSGIGIPKDKVQIIFDRFRQAEETFEARKYGGTGLGLSIAKGLIELMGGKIWVESEYGNGSNFYFTIPFKPEHLLLESNIKINKTEYAWTSKKILIVEDDAYNIQYISEILNLTQVQFEVAICAKDAMALFIEKSDFELILMDIRLPDINGFELTKMMKAINPDCFIIAQTAYATDDDKMRSISAGCNDFIAKPIDADKLLRIIDQYFK